MRASRSFLSSASAASAASVGLALALAVVPSASAQDPDGPPGCVQANPCDLILAVDADGFADVSETEFTSGDWVYATTYNGDEVEHTLSLASHSFTVTIAPGDLVDSEPFRVGPPGTYTLSDDPSGDTLQVTSLAADEFDGGDSGGSDGAGNGIPGVAPTVLLAVLVAAAIVARRH